jgi:hypothetical protein
LNGRHWKLLRHANDIVSQIFIVIFFVVMGAVPLTILVLGTINFIRALTRRGTIVLQALAALAIWTFLTYVIIMILVVIIFSQPYPLSPANELKSTVVFIVGCLIYIAAGAGLIIWTKRQAKLSQTTPG